MYSITKFNFYEQFKRGNNFDELNVIFSLKVDIITIFSLNPNSRIFMHIYCKLIIYHIIYKYRLYMFYHLKIIILNLIGLIWKKNSITI